MSLALFNNLSQCLDFGACNRPCWTCWTFFLVIGGGDSIKETGPMEPEVDVWRNKQQGRDKQLSGGNMSLMGFRWSKIKIGKNDLMKKDMIIHINTSCNRIYTLIAFVISSLADKDIPFK